MLFLLFPCVTCTRTLLETDIVFTLALAYRISCKAQKWRTCGTRDTSSNRNQFLVEVTALDLQLVARAARHHPQTKPCTTTRRTCMRRRSPENDIWFAHVRFALSLQSLLHSLFHDATVCHSVVMHGRLANVLKTTFSASVFLKEELYSNFRKMIHCVALCWLSEIVA